MEYKIRYLPLAVQDLHEIAGYLSGFYPGSASRVLRELERRIAQLRQMPRMYPVYPLEPDYRKLTASQYLVFYRVTDETQTVEIHRVLRASWDLPRYLK